MSDFDFDKLLEEVQEPDEVKEAKLEDLVPQYLLFASSLNYELVYIILKSIISFAHINNTKEGRIHSNSGKIRIHEDTTLMDTVIEIKSFTVKDQTVVETELRRSSTISEASMRASEIATDGEVKRLIVNSRIKVTFYQRKLFQEAFKEYMPDLETIKESLSPKKNSD